MRRIVLIFWLGLLTVLWAPGVQASTYQPLILQIDGDLWAWGGPQSGLNRLTYWANDGFLKGHLPHYLSISPDGNRLAYTGEAPLFGAYRKLCKCQGYAGAEFPLDIWVVDLATGKETWIAQQPGTAHLDPTFADHQPVEYLARSKPVWSLDGSYLAWTDVEINPKGGGLGGAYRLLLYDFAHTETRIVDADLGVKDGTGWPVPVVWSQEWMVVRQNPEQGMSEANVITFSLNGNVVSSVKFSKGLDEVLFTMRVGNTEQVVVRGNPPDPSTLEYGWMLIDPQSGSVMPMRGIPEIFSLTAPGGLTIIADSNFENRTVSVDSAVDVPASDEYAISPDGTQIAYSTGWCDNCSNPVYVYSSGKVISFDAPGKVRGIAWGPTDWRIQQRTP
jgi:hypothetical protein